MTFRHERPIRHARVGAELAQGERSCSVRCREGHLAMMWSRTPQGPGQWHLVKHFAAPGNHAAVSVRPIVVGVNGSTDSIRALEWAVVRAYAGHAPLRIVHVAQPALWLDPFAFTAYWDAGPLEGAQELLEDAVQRARHRVPFLQVSAVLCRTNPATALLNEGRTADLI